MVKPLPDAAPRIGPVVRSLRRSNAARAGRLTPSDFGAPFAHCVVDQLGNRIGQFAASPAAVSCSPAWPDMDSSRHHNAA